MKDIDKARELTTDESKMLDTALRNSVRKVEKPIDKARELADFLEEESGYHSVRKSDVKRTLYSGAEMIRQLATRCEGMEKVVEAAVAAVTCDPEGNEWDHLVEEVEAYKAT